MPQGEAYGVLRAVDEMFDAKVGSAWRVHTSKAYVLVWSSRVAVPWPTKWSSRSKLFTLKTF